MGLLGPIARLGLMDMASRLEMRRRVTPAGGIFRAE